MDAEEATTETDWWTVHRSASPVVATAIHNGHGIDAELLPLLALSPEQRLREEDPFTEFIIRDAPNRIVSHRSRFTVDLNRARDQAVYLRAEQAWGLEVWKRPPEDRLIERSLQFHDQYYGMLRTMLRGLEAQFGRFVVLDVHSYNHRRDGPDAPPAGADAMPEINIGTFSMNRRKWAWVVDPFIDWLRGFEFRGRRMDVRANVAFQGKGEQTRFIHHEFPETGCAIAVEFKKFFMDEWTGRPDPDDLGALRALVASTVPLLEETIQKGRG